MSLLENVEKRGFKDILNPKKWKVFIVWLLKLALNRLSKSETKEVAEEAQKATRLYTKSELEQVIYRRRLCKECWERGSCVACGCDAVGEMQDLTTKCADGKWKAAMDAPSWESYKSKLGIKI